MRAFLFGTSIPTIDSPGTGASILKLGAARANAKSFSLATILSTFTRVPLSLSSSKLSSSLSFFLGLLVFLVQPGVSPYIVTVGPGFI